MSEWITDRLPTAEDADCYGSVWTAYNGEVVIRFYGRVDQGTPWIPLAPPEPYVAPKPKCYVMISTVDPDKWVVFNGPRCVADRIPTREAAERIAAIYNEVVS